MNKATRLTSGDTAARSARASSTRRRRGLFSANTRPMASTPSSQAMRTSPARVNPQNLMRVLTDAVFMGLPR